MIFEKPIITRRLIIAIILAIGMIVLRLFDKVSAGEFSTVITAIIGFYFRENEIPSIVVNAQKHLKKEQED